MFLNLGRSRLARPTRDHRRKPADEKAIATDTICGQGLLAVGLPLPVRKVVQTGLRQVGEAVEHVGEPSLRVDNVELGGADESLPRISQVTASPDA